MKIFKAVFLAASLVGTASMAQERSPLIWAEISPTSLIRGTEVLLGDVARVNGTDQKLIERARSLPLTRTPATGQVLLLRRDSIRKLLRDSGALGRSILLRGAEEAVVTVEDMTMSSNDVLTLALAHLYKTLGRDAASTRIIRTWSPSPLVAPVGRYLTRFEVLNPMKGPLGSGIIRLEVRPVVDGVPYKGTVVEVAVRRKTSVLVAARDLRPRQHVDPTAVRLERRDLPGHLDGFITDFADLDGLVTKIRIRPGEVLRRSSFARRPIVERNQAVRVIYRNGGLTIDGEGVTLGKGALGDRIPVRVGKRKHIIYAEILDSKTVQVTAGTLRRRTS